MDFLKAALGQNNPQSGSSFELSKEAFRKGEEMAVEFVERLNNVANKYHKAGASREACLVLFVGVLKAYYAVHRGVIEVNKVCGEENPAVQTWDFLATALTAGSEEEGLKAIDEWVKRHGGQ